MNCEIFTPVEAAKVLNVSVNTLTRWRCRRVGPAFCKFGKVVRYRLQDLDAWLVSKRKNPGETKVSGG